MIGFVFLQPQELVGAIQWGFESPFRTRVKRAQFSGRFVQRGQKSQPLANAQVECLHH